MHGDKVGVIVCCFRFDKLLCFLESKEFVNLGLLVLEIFIRLEVAKEFRIYRLRMYRLVIKRNGLIMKALLM